MWSYGPNPALAGITDAEIAIAKLLLTKIEKAYDAKSQFFKASEVNKVLGELVDEACARDEAAERRAA